VPFETGKRDVQQEHRGILEAALARDADKAARLLTEHLEETTRILLRFVNESDELPNATARELTL
jgi:GntR family carbon starvation induced transcriptional regulator